VEASALHAPAGLSRRLPLAIPLLRLRSDEQLLALFRSGSDEAFGVLHDRYRQRLFAYVRQMLSGHSRQDAEDVLQDVFVRAFGALRVDDRAVNVRAWLYRVAHNRCIDHLRRPHPPAAEIFEMSRKPLLDPVDEAQRRDDLKRLVGDVGRLPEQQRSALLMREIYGLSYADLAGALDVTVPAVKSLLVRARVGLVEAQEARDADCGEIQRDLTASYDRGVKASGRARRHMRECAGCREYRHALRGVRRSFAALTPAGAGPIALLAKLIGIGGAGGGGGAAVFGGAAAAGGGGSAAALGGAATATACKVAAVICATAITAGGAVEVTKFAHQPPPKRERAASGAAKATAPVAAAAAASGALALHSDPATLIGRPAVPAAPVLEPVSHRSVPAATVDEPIVAPPPEAVLEPGNGETPVPVGAEPQVSSGGTAAPEDTDAEAEPAGVPSASLPTGTSPVVTQPPASATPGAEPSPAPADPADPAEPGGTTAPPPER
jgi:RNA polymerase sigma factor (sigma-70 family)